MPSQNLSDADQLEHDLSPNPHNLNEHDPHVARDPVCGMLVEKRTAQNTMSTPINTATDTIYFCSAQCKTTFEQNPQQFGFNL